MLQALTVAGRGQTRWSEESHETNLPADRPPDWSCCPRATAGPLGVKQEGNQMRTYFFLLIFLWWLLLLLTFVPALMVGLLCAWRMAGMTWRKGLAAGLAGGFAGVASSMAWYWFTWLLPPNDMDIIGYFLLPIPSAASAWAICCLWQRRPCVQPFSPPDGPSVNSPSPS